MKVENKEKEVIQDGINILKKQCKEMTDEQLIIYLEGHHKSDVYIILTEVLTNKRKAKLRMAFRDRFEVVEKQANQMHEHDIAFARNIDVDRACSIVYSTLLRMIKSQQDSINEMSDKIAELEGTKPTVVNKNEGNTIQSK